MCRRYSIKFTCCNRPSEMKKSRRQPQPTGEASLTTGYFRPVRHFRYATYEYLTEKGEVKSITGISSESATVAAAAAAYAGSSSDAEHLLTD